MQLGTVDKHGFIWTVPRETFVKLYVATGDAATAARDAKLPPEDDPEVLLQEESIRNAVADLHEQVLRRVHETVDTVTARYSNIAEGDVFDYIDAGELNPNGRLQLAQIKPKDWRKMPRHMRQRVKKFRVSHAADNNINFEIEMHDPMKANDMLVRLLGLDTEEAGDDAKTFAEQIHVFLHEVEELDQHYDDPDKKE